LISFGAILGKCSIFQLWVMATLEVFFYCLNEAILIDIFQVYDIGGSMVIHTFGAFFGLACAFFYLAITSSVIGSIIVARMTHGGKLNMEIILNASLAGGVAVGSAADIIVMPFGAMLAGFVTGIISSLGFAYISAYLRKTISLHDTCGVLNLHGMPGLIGGIVSAIVASRLEGNFGEKYPVWQKDGRTP